MVAEHARHLTIVAQRLSIRHAHTLGRAASLVLALRFSWTIELIDFNILLTSNVARHRVGAVKSIKSFRACGHNARQFIDC